MDIETGYAESELRVSRRSNRDIIRDIVEGLLADGATPQPLADDAVLADAGISSLAMVKLLLALESAFDLEVPRREITQEAFTSVASLDALIMRLTGTPGAAQLTELC
jgi:acyl carrier protein